MSRRPDQAMLRRRVRLAQGLLLAIVVAGTVYVADTVVGANLLRTPDRVTVELAGAGGLHEQSIVTYRGQRVGAVHRIALSDDGVDVTFDLDHGAQVPRDSEFAVSNLSAVGEQYIDIRPRTAEGPFLADGDVVGREQTTLPLPTHRVLAHTQRLLSRIDLADVETLTRESEAIFADGAADLRGLTREAEDLLELLGSLQDDTTTLLRTARTPLRTGVDLEPDIRALGRDAELIGAELARLTPAARRLIASAGIAVPTVQAFWDATAPMLGRLTRVALPLTEMAASRLPGLHHWLDWVPAQAEGMAGSTRGGTGRVLLVPKVLKNCIYTDAQRPPDEITRRPPVLDDHCTTDAPDLQQRGARNVPRP